MDVYKYPQNVPTKLIIFLLIWHPIGDAHNHSPKITVKKEKLENIQVLLLNMLEYSVLNFVHTVITSDLFYKCILEFVKYMFSESKKRKVSNCILIQRSIGLSLGI